MKRVTGINQIKDNDIFVILYVGSVSVLYTIRFYRRGNPNELLRIVDKLWPWGKVKNFKNKSIGVMYFVLTEDEYIEHVVKEEI